MNRCLSAWHLLCQGLIAELMVQWLLQNYYVSTDCHNYMII